MSPATKKLFLALTIAIGISLLLLSRQIKTARSITVRVAQAPLVSPFAVDLPITTSDPLLGNPGAPLTIVIFGDLADASVRSLVSTVTEFVSGHPAAARFVFKPTPREHLWGNSLLAHQALECTRSSRFYWPLLAHLVKTPTITARELSLAAPSIGLNGDELVACAQLPTTKQAILNATATAESLGISLSPALFVNNKLINLDEGVDVPQMLGTFIQP